MDLAKKLHGMWISRMSHFQLGKSFAIVFSRTYDYLPSNYVVLTHFVKYQEGFYSFAVCEKGQGYACKALYLLTTNVNRCARDAVSNDIRT